jgi:hypothetical protein
MKQRVLATVEVIIEPENLVTIIGIVIAAILGYFSIVNNDIQQALTAILTILGATAIAQLVSGYENAKTKKIIERIENQVQNLNSLPNPPLRLRSELASLRERTRNAKDILIIGRTAVNALRNADLFEEKLTEGVTIRIAIINPDNDPVLDFIPILQETSKEGAVADRLSAKGLIKRIQQKACDPALFQVRVFDYVPTISFVMVDGSLPTGYIVAELIPYQIGSSLRPHLYLTANDTPSWYTYFHKVCESIWRDAKPFQTEKAA